MRLANLIRVIVMSPRSVRLNVIHRPGKALRFEKAWSRDLPELLRASCRMAGIVECRARRTIADLADPADVVDLAGLMLRRSPGQSRDRDGVCIWAPCAPCKPSKPRP